MDELRLPSAKNLDRYPHHAAQLQEDRLLQINFLSKLKNDKQTWSSHPIYPICVEEFGWVIFVLEASAVVASNGWIAVLTGLALEIGIDRRPVTCESTMSIENCLQENEKKL